MEPKWAHHPAQPSLVETCFLLCMGTEKTRRVVVGMVEAVRVALRSGAKQSAESVVGLHKVQVAPGRLIWSPDEVLVTVDLALAPAPDAAQLAVRAGDPGACPH